MNMIYLNGEFTQDTAPVIHHKNCGFTTGIGIFDSMLVIEGQPQHITEHFERILFDSKTVIGISPTLNNFAQIITELLNKNNLNNGYARIRTTITGGRVDAPLAKAKNLSILIDAAPCTAPSQTPVTCAIITDFPRIAGCKLENCKRLDYTRSYAARRQAEGLGATEAILTNTQGNIACGATSNIFIEEDDALITPPLTDGVLAGITRRKIMEERKVKQESISVDRLKNSDKAYITNSFIGLRPITFI